MTAPLDLAAFMAFIRGVDIPNTIEAARVALVERALRAEQEIEQLRAERDMLQAWPQEQVNIALMAVAGKYLDNHSANADAEGMSALCECRVCLEARALISEK
jgi:hypothetical protein